MSYCRFSSDDYQCDVYVYEDQSGRLVTHVAAQRYVLDGLPPPVPFDEQHLLAFVMRAARVTKIVEDAKQVVIGLPHDGETFEDATAAECAGRLERLRELGYRVPDYAIEMLRADEDDAPAQAAG